MQLQKITYKQDDTKVSQHNKMLLEKPTGLNNAQKDCSVSAKHHIQLFRCLTGFRQKCCLL